MAKVPDSRWRDALLRLLAFELRNGVREILHFGIYGVERRGVGPLSHLHRRDPLLEDGQWFRLQQHRIGRYSIRINDQYRICFPWKEDGAHNVEITKYYR